ncbi:autotransporter-associated beta strand repeat-containing protein, partial [Synechococcus sp. UW179B]|uniref:autotransporter-associated beta strand repeat-containing protein n=1 Tax=Synechococcus sp. UW179B TaxID=2575516 RepID=UPI0014827FEE
MSIHSSRNFIFLLVFALLCGDWAEPAKARAAVGGHKALSKLLPDSSNASTTDILLAQAAKPKNFPDDQKIPPPGPDTKDMVTLWQLPEDFKSVIVADSGDIYGIYYSAWNRESEYVQLPGVFGSGWIDGSKNNNYQPWKDNSVLAEELSVKYLAQKQSFMVECDSSKDYQTGCVDEVNGKKVKNLNLYGFWNGGGFAYGAIKSDRSISRPSGGETPKIGYYWNGELYSTNGGDNYKIQFFAGCKLNTINSSVSVSVSVSGLSSPEDCKNGTAPVLDGGSLNFDTKQEYSSSLYVTSKGGKIDNNGENLILDGTIQSIGDPSDSPSSLFFEGPRSTSLQGNNSYLNPTTVKEGVLEITNVDGLGSADAGTRVEERAVLRITVDGRPTPQGSTSNDAKINEKITLAGGELDLNGNYIDLKGGVVLEAKDVNSTIRVKDGSTEVFARSIISGKGGLIKDGKGFLRLGGRGPQTYEGVTIIEAGELRFANTTSTPSTTEVTVNQGATLRLMGGSETPGGLNTVRSIKGEGRISLNTDEAHLSVDVPSGENPEFKGSILGGPRGDSLEGTFIKDGAGSLTLSGKNSYGSLIVEGGQLDINGENIYSDVINPSEASVSLRLGHDLSVKGGSALRVTGRDLDPTFGPRVPGEATSSDGTISKIALHTLPVIEFDDSINELTVENGSLLVASFTGALPTDYDAYKDNCNEGSNEKTCYSIRPQISFGNGADSMFNNGLVVGPGEGGTGNHLQLRFEGGNDILNNGLSEGTDSRSGSWLGCVTAGADEKGFNGYKFGNTCAVANDATGEKLPEANIKDANRSYTVNVFMGGGNDKFTNHQASYLRGGFYGESGDDTLENQGVIRGNIVMGKGSDTVTFQGGRAENDGQSRGLGVIDDRLVLGNSIKVENDNSPGTDVNKLNLFGNAVVSYRNSLGWGVEETSGKCGGKPSTTGRSDYGCRWDDGGYNYSAIVGSKGKDNIWVKKKSDGTQPVQIWGSVELGASNDALRLQNFEGYGAALHLVGDLDLGTGDSQTIVIEENGNFSVRAIRGDNIDFQISGLATLGGDSELGVFAADRDVDLKQGNTLSSYTGTTTVNEGGMLRAGQEWSLSSKSIHKVDGTLKLGDNTERNGNERREDQEIGELTGEGSVNLQNQSHLFYGGLNGNVEFSGKSSANGSLVKVGSGTTTFSGEFAHTGFTKVNDGTLLIGKDTTGEDGKLSKDSTVLLGGSGGTLDLGGTIQVVDKIELFEGKSSTLKNGFLNTGVVNVQGTGFIDGVRAVVANTESESILDRNGNVIDPGSAQLKVNGFDYDGYLTLTGDNHFADLELIKGKVLLGSVNKGISESGSLVLDGGITGSAYSDSLVLQGALTLDEEQAIDLGGGDDLFLIGAKGSLIAAPLVDAEADLVVEVDSVETDKEEIKKLKITIDGGAGDLDIFWDASGNYYSLTESADGLFTESEDSQLAGNVKNLELVGVAGQGIAYFGTTPSFATIQPDASPPPGEYGLMLGSVGKDKSLIGGVDQKLTINSGYDSGATDSLITKVGGISLGKGAATIVVPGGTLEAGIIYGREAKSTIELGSAFTGEVKSDALKSVAKGRFDVGVLYGYDTINQLGGLWSYNGQMDQTNLLAQGVVRLEADDNATFKSITARERFDKDKSLLGINGRSVIAVSGALTVGEGGIQEQGTARASLLVASRDGAKARVYLIGVSNYSGPTIVARGGSLHADDNALSSVSKTLVGNEGSINIDGSQDINRLLIRKRGEFIGGLGSTLTTKSIVNQGDISLNSLVIEDGMTRFLDRYINFKDRRGDSVPVESPLRKIDAQGSLKNIGGSISLKGDLKFISSGDAGGHALLNLTTGGLKTKEISLAAISANSIQFSDKNDVLINSGFVQTTGASGINFGGGNDLVLTKGAFSIASGSKIDGGDKLDTSNWKPGNRSITGLNIFKAYEDPGVVESDLENWAAIKLGSDQDWLFPQGGECRVTGVGNIYSKDTVCVGLTGQKQDQFVQIDSGARLDAGVIALGRGSSNTIEVRNGELHAILIEGSPGQTENATNDRLLLGDGSGSSGELIVGAITGFDSMEQRGGTWSYAVNGVDDPQVKERLIKSGRRTAEELDEMGSFPAFTGYGIAKIAPVEITGRNKKQKTVQRAAFARIEGTNPELPLQVQNIDSELEVTEGIFGNASLSTSGNTLLNGESSYTGPTTIQSGGELKAGNSLALSPLSEITIEPGGVLDLDGYDNKIFGLSGGSRSASDPGIVKLSTNCLEDAANSCTKDLPGGILSVSRGNFDGVIEDVPDSSGALIKYGSFRDILTLGGLNQYFSPTLIRGGVLKASADQALSPNS